LLIKCRTRFRQGSYSRAGQTQGSGAAVIRQVGDKRAPLADMLRTGRRENRDGRSLLVAALLWRPRGEGDGRPKRLGGGQVGGLELVEWGAERRWRRLVGDRRRESRGDQTRWLECGKNPEQAASGNEWWHAMLCSSAACGGGVLERCEAGCCTGIKGG
jgi:hypothetical protein